MILEVSSAINGVSAHKKRPPELPGPPPQWKEGTVYEQKFKQTSNKKRTSLNKDQLSNSSWTYQYS